MMEIDIDTHTRLGDLKVAHQQLVAIVRALSQNAVVILDEPTSALTDKDGKAVIRAVKRLKDLGYIVIYISHKLQEVLEVTDEIIVFRNGQKIGQYGSAELDEEKLAELIAGRKLENKYPKGIPQGEELLRFEHISVEGCWRTFHFRDRGRNPGHRRTFGGRKDRNSQGVVGVFGKHFRVAGDIYLDSKKLPPGSRRRQLPEKIGLVPENRAEEGLVTEMSILDNIILASLKDVSRLGWINRRRKVKGIMDEMVAALQIKCAGVEYPVSSLSGGTSKRLYSQSG